MKVLLTAADVRRALSDWIQTNRKDIVVPNHFNLDANFEKGSASFVCTVTITETK